ncbi:MAG: hypothetical protein Terrestrivirus1_301 [Terrestrivirus sp.]|uniref:Uncharacterized protein n=1 Tax=Terrestrivirus sp. TaxID=2487775 RepID=A0A3G4ZKR3_9VIRU|nr:MAG: hypothetical protein Terrestrivirus1_301 [Terrestrivirus sp.]
MPSIYKLYDNLLRKLNFPSNITLTDATNKLLQTNFSFFQEYININKNVTENNYDGIQTGGFVYYYDFKNKMYRFNVNVEDEDDRTTYAIYNNAGLVCMMLFIPKKNHYVYIQTISAENSCVMSGNPKTKIGTLLFLMTLDLIKTKLTDKYGLKYIQLHDTSYYYCEKLKDKIEFDSLYMLSHGDTWYGKYGFIPFNETTQKINKDNMKIYENNKKIVNSKLMKNTKIKQYLNKLMSKEKIDKLYDIYKDKTINEFFYDLSKQHDKTCYITGKIYKQFMVDNGIINLHGGTYYLPL